MANPISLPPFFQKIPRKNTVQRAMDLIILFILLSILVYRFQPLNQHGFTWLLAFLCESWFTFIWVLNVNTKWNPVEHQTYPERLLQRVCELPAVDMFVTTADPALEPPIITVNTVLSLLAVDYPDQSLACYVSDDSGSPVTFYSLLEASKFAKLWVPFCKKYAVPVRAPFQYFYSSEPVCSSGNSLEFQQEWRKMKNEYEQLTEKIEEAVRGTSPCDLTGEFEVFSNIERGNHPTIIKVLWENSERLADGVPHLVYISREKRPKHPHHYKAGAMNALTRVSGIMTNAPFMLNVDCDMYAHNPQVVLHAMCLLLGFENPRDSGFVQFPQLFYGGLKNNRFVNHILVIQEYLAYGFAGIQGPPYIGTGCFHRRKVIYGLSPNDGRVEAGNSITINGKSPYVSLFGNSVELTKSAAHILQELNASTTKCLRNLSSSVELAYQVADCSYEYGTGWGSKVGWLYGSTAEDALTGLAIHVKGWRSIYCTPSPPAFLGCATSSGPPALTQQKRWATGLLQILFSKNNSLIGTLTAKLQFRQCLAHLWFHAWGLRSIPEFCYATLPAYCLIVNTRFLPAVDEPAILLHIAVSFIYNSHSLSEYLRIGLSTRAWWNCQRVLRIMSATAWLLGFLNGILTLLGLSNAIFEVTQKDETDANCADAEAADNDGSRFTFDGSLAFVLGTALLLVHLGALATVPLKKGTQGPGIGEVFCSLWVVLSFWPFMRGLIGRGKYGIPTSTMFKSAALALLFLQFCQWTVIS